MSDFDSNIAYQAVRRNSCKLVQSGIDPIVLAAKLDSSNAINETDYRLVIDRNTAASSQERLQILVDSVKENVKYNSTVFGSFVKHLNESGIPGRSIAQNLMASYQGILTR